MTTDEARRTLLALDGLIAALEQKSGSLDRDQLQILRMLRRRRGMLRGLLNVRDAERAKKVVDLELWRDGYVEPMRVRAAR